MSDRKAQALPLRRRVAVAIGGALIRAASVFSAGAAQQRNVYKGAEISRLWYDWIASPISADQEMYNDFLRLRSRSRELSRNSPVIRNYLQMLRTNVIGPTGFKFKPEIADNSGKLNDILNKRLARAWSDWSSCCTVDGSMSLTMFQQHLIRNLATDGEVIVRKIWNYQPNRFKFALQQIDPDLLDHMYFRAPDKGVNEVRLGVEVDEWGRPIAYHFWKRHPTDIQNVTPNERVRVPADEVLHIFVPDRANQTRGVPWLNSIMMPSKIMDGYIEAELVAARTGAAKMGFFQWKDVEGAEPPQPGERLTMEASPGQLEMLPPGLEFKEWSPDHPANAFPNFIKAILRLVASGLGVSYNVLANDLEGVNYSSMRSGLLIERDNWRALQVMWIERFLTFVYKEWLDCALLSGALVLDSRDPSKFLDVKFLPRGWAWVDPLKDINASVAAVNNGLATRDMIVSENGDDFEEIAAGLAREAEMIKKYKLNITGVGIGPGAAAADEAETPAQEDTNRGKLHVIGDHATRDYMTRSLNED